MSPFERERYPPAGATPGPEAWAEVWNEVELVHRFRERVRLFAYRRLQDSATAEDVAQETLRRVMEACKAGRLKNPAALPAFLFQTAHHICLQHYRSTGREGRALRRFSSEDRQEDYSPLTTLIGDERRTAVRQALERLSTDDRELLRKIYYEGMETAPLAQRLGVTVGTLRVRKHRVLARLAALLNGEEI